jgi:hypothetical protein
VAGMEIKHSKDNEKPEHSKTIFTHLEVCYISYSPDFHITGEHLCQLHNGFAF